MSLIDEVLAEERARLGAPKAAPAARPRTLVDEYLDETASRPRMTARPATSRVQRPVSYDRSQSAIYGAADAITFGYLDEAGAVIDMFTRGGSYTENRDRNRAQLDELARQNPNSFFAGQIGGSLAGPGAALGAGVKGVKGMAVAGATQGAVYGSGSSDAETVGGVLSDTWDGAKIGAAGGAAFGLTFKAVKWGYPRAAKLVTRKRAQIETGDAVKLPPKTKAAPKAPEAPKVTPKAASGAAKVADEVPPPKPAEGAIASKEELLTGKTATARERINKMTQQQAAELAEKIDAAEAAGDVVSDPHYRSMLDVGLSDEAVEMDQVIRAVNEFEDLTEEVRRKAASGPTTQAAATKDLQTALKEQELDKLAADAIERTSKGMSDARLGQHLMTLAGVRFTKARDAFLDLVRQGDAEAKLKMTDMIVEALDWFTKGATIRSNQGRALNTRGSKVELLLEDLPDNVVEANQKTARERVEEALKELGDDGVTQLLTKLRSMEDLDGLVEVLNDPAYAAQFTTFQKARSSISTFLRSNAFSATTGVINATSAVMHDWFRNKASRRFAAWSAQRGGRLDEAAALRLENEVADAVYAQVHREGLNAFIGRIKWEFWDDVNRISQVGWGSGKIATRAASNKAALASRAPITAREEKAIPRLTFTADQVQGTIDSLGDSIFANIAGHAIRAGAVAANSIDAAGTLMGKVMIGAVDDWASTWVRLKETHVQTARFAVREGLDLRLTGDDLIAHAKTRITEMNDMPPKEVLDRVEDALLSNTDLDPELQFLAQRDKLAKNEADKVLFMDGVQTIAGRASVQVAETVDIVGGLGQVRNTIVPFIRTPIRIFERGLASYTPWGAKTDEMAQLLAKGGPEAAITQAQIHLGTMGIALGAALGASGILTLTNGAWDSTANLDAGPPNRINVGDKYVEIGRMDPFSLTLAVGGLIGQAMRDGFREGTEYDAYEGARAAMATFFIAGPRDAFLSKSYLTGLKELNEMLFARNGDSLVDNVSKHVAGIMTRLVPLGGQSRQINDTLHGSAVEAITFTDQMLRTIPGAGIYAPIRRDILGDPIKGRTFGFQVGDSGSTEGEAVTPVKAELRDLNIDVPAIRKADPAGFDLSAKQLDRLRELRGKEALNDNGENLQEALGGLFADGWYRGLEKYGKRQAVLEVIRDFNAPARELLLEEDADYRAQVTGRKALKAAKKDGAKHMDALRAAEEEVEAEGLPDPKLRGLADWLRSQ